MSDTIFGDYPADDDGRGSGAVTITSPPAYNRMDVTVFAANGSAVIATEYVGDDSAPSSFVHLDALMALRVAGHLAVAGVLAATKYRRRGYRHPPAT